MFELNKQNTSGKFDSYVKDNPCEGERFSFNLSLNALTYDFAVIARNLDLFPIIAFIHEEAKSNIHLPILNI